jgi:outer membrane protein
MKNGLLIWNIVLTLIAGYLLYTQFRSKKSSPEVVGKTSIVRDTTAQGFRIAYFEMDSIENSFQMVKDVQAEISRKEKDYNNDLARLDYTYKTRYEGYQAKAATMSKEDYEKAKIDLKQLEDQLKGEKQRYDQDYQEFVMHRQLDLKSTIADFLKEYNKSKKYSYIIVYERDLFYYKDTAYNITSEVLRGLNERYRNRKK